MLLRFTAPDMLNTCLVDVASGERAYEITTEVLVTDSSATSSKSFSPTASVEPIPSESIASSSSSASWKAPLPADTTQVRRRTLIRDHDHRVLAEVMWTGRRPDVTICDEKIGGLTDLFGSSSVRFMPKVLAIPTRFDTEYVWIASADSLSLIDYDSDTIKGSFHQNCIRIPGPLGKSSKSKQASPTKSAPSSPVVEAGAAPQLPSAPTPKSTFIPTHLAGLGSNYIEFESHPLALDIEIILSFMMMEILRRGRFSLNPYAFDERPPSPFKEARDLLMRRLRRNTV